MNKIKYTTLMLLVIFCIVPVVSILMIHHLTLADTLGKMGSGVLGKSSATFKMENYSGPMDIIKALESQRESIAIYTDKSNDLGTTRYIFFNDEYVNLPMKKGRFFKNSDFQADNNVCVVGKDREKDCYTVDGELYFADHNAEYRVIGILGYESDTIYDSYVFVNMCVSELDEAQIYVLDFMDRTYPDRTIDELMNLWNGSGVTAVKCAQASSFSESVMPKVITARWFIGLLIACFCCLLLISIRWVEQQRRELAIHRMVGASKSDIIALIVCKYIGVFAVSFVVGYVYCNVVFPAYYASLMQGYSVCGIFIIAFLIWSIVRILGTPIEEVIR